MAWIKKHATWANLFYTLAWTYAIAGAVYMAFEGFSWWTLADVIAYSTLLWMIASTSKKEALHFSQMTQLEKENKCLWERLETYALAFEGEEALRNSDKPYRVDREVQ